MRHEQQFESVLTDKMRAVSSATNKEMLNDSELCFAFSQWWPYLFRRDGRLYSCLNTQALVCFDAAEAINPQDSDISLHRRVTTLHTRIDDRFELQRATSKGR